MYLHSSCVDRICGGTFTSLSGSTSHAPVYCMAIILLWITYPKIFPTNDYLVINLTAFSRPFTVKVHFNDFEMSDPRAPDQMNRGNFYYLAIQCLKWAWPLTSSDLTVFRILSRLRAAKLSSEWKAFFWLIASLATLVFFYSKVIL